MLVCRKAEIKDALLYFEWVNDEAVRRNSFNQNKVEFTEHKKWFDNKIKDPDCMMFIANVNGKDAGQIRFEKAENNTYEIDFSIEKDSRGKGIGGDLIRAGTQEFFREMPAAGRVIGKVKAENIPSKRSFINAGFKLMGNPTDHPDFDIYYFDNNKNDIITLNNQ